MHRAIATALIIALTCAHVALAAPLFAITAKQDTVERREGQSQQLPRGTTHLTSSEVCYVFTLKPSSLTIPTNATAQWVVLKESKDGRLAPGTRGQQAITPAGPGKAIEIRTDTIPLTEREWTGRARLKHGSVEDSIYGYALRIISDTGFILAEKYDPARMKDKADWTQE